jgi:hypothetical protein
LSFFKELKLPVDREKLFKIAQDRPSYIDESCEMVYPLGYKIFYDGFSKFGLSPEITKELKIGYCSYGFDSKIGYKCENCFIHKQKRDDKSIWIHNGMCLFAKNRIMTPITQDDKLFSIESRDISGRSGSHKVLYPVGSNSSKTIFNYNNLKTDEPLYVVEGIKNVWKLWENISRNATAIFNNRVKGDQGKLLERFDHVIVIPDLGRAGEQTVKDLCNLKIRCVEVVNLPKVVYCKKCGLKFRGDEKKDICPGCNSDGLSYADVYDTPIDTLKACIDNRISSVNFLTNSIVEQGLTLEE